MPIRPAGTIVGILCSPTIGGNDMDVTVSVSSLTSLFMAKLGSGTAAGKRHCIATSRSMGRNDALCTVSQSIGIVGCLYLIGGRIISRTGG